MTNEQPPGDRIDVARAGSPWAPATIADWLWVIVCVLLGLLLILLGGVALLVLLHAWFGAVALAAGVAAAVALARLSRRALWLTAALAVPVGWLGALILSGWDIDGTLDERWDELPYAAVAWGAVAVCVWGFAAGVVCVTVARGWLTRACALAIGNAGAFALLGIALL
jgi:hypothetical protein